MIWMDIEEIADAMAATGIHSREDIMRALSDLVEQHPPNREWTEKTLAEAVDDWLLKDGIAQNLRDGTMELVGYGKNGEPRYRLTEKGKRRAEELRRSGGKP